MRRLSFSGLIVLFALVGSLCGFNWPASVFELVAVFQKKSQVSRLIEGVNISVLTPNANCFGARPNAGKIGFSDRSHVESYFARAARPNVRSADAFSRLIRWDDVCVEKRDSLPRFEMISWGLPKVLGKNIHFNECPLLPTDWHDRAAVDEDVCPHLALGGLLASFHETFSSEPQEQCSKGQNKGEKCESDGGGCGDGFRGPLNGSKPRNCLSHINYPFPVGPAIIGLLIAIALTAIGGCLAWVLNR
jgi:hypothetical protein